MTPIYLRHKDAGRQAAIYGVFAAIVLGVIGIAFVLQTPGYWLMLVLLPVAAFLTYSAVRLATLRVRLDDDGIWEPNPFKLTFCTPWSDVAQVRKVTTRGAGKMRFIAVEIVHTDGVAREIVALKIQGGAAFAEPTLEGWIDTIRAARP